MLEDAAPNGMLALHLWRLLDWTFLLPNPQPESLAYGGVLTREEERALTVLEPGCRRLSAQDPAQTGVEVVLLDSPTYQQARTGAAALVPGGWICIRHRRSFLSWGSPRTLAGWQRFLQRSGFGEIAVHWFAPGLDRPARIVPAASKTAVMDTLARHNGVPWGKAKAAIGRLAFTLGLFPMAIPEGVIVAQRRQPTPRGGRHELR